MNGSVTYEGLILHGGINVDVNANLEELTAHENGVYNPSEGKAGFSKVTVDVPAAVLDDITITENGHYTPPIGVDGYNDIVVTVPHPAPVLNDITITENGSYQPPSGVDGYDDITVNVLPTLDNISITANGTYTPPTGTDGYNEITVNVPLPANGIYKQTLTGLPSPIATFTGADAPIDSLKASIVGVQDLHGYDKPWVGGAGKNKWNEDYTGISSNITYKGIYVGNGTFTISTTTPAEQGVASLFFLAGNVSTGASTATNGVFAGAPRTITSIDGYVTVAYRAFSPEYSPENYETQVESGSIATSYTPYSNICPISGWSSCDVTVTDDLTDPTYTNTYTIPFKDSSDNPITVYDGSIDVSGGKLTVTHANIASYNGETINEPWISSKDAYTQGATPTTGAQVVYPLTTPLIYDFDPIAVRSNGVTNISVNCGEVTECKYYSETP